MELFYLDRDGRLLGSIMAFSFWDAHAWLAMQNIRYDSLTKYRPRKRKRRDRYLAAA